MYLANNLESHVKQILKNPQKYSILRCLFKPLVEKYLKGKEIDREIKTRMDIIYLVKGKKSPGDLIEIAIRAFNLTDEEKQEQLLLSLIKEEVSRIIFDSTTLNLNKTVVEIKFFDCSVQTAWNESLKQSGLKVEPVNVLLGKDAAYIDLIREESKERITRSALRTYSESRYLKLIEVEVQQGRHLNGLILFSSISSIFSGFFEERVRRIHKLIQHELFLPVKSKLFRVELKKVLMINPKFSKEYSGFYVENYLTHEEFIKLFESKSVVDLSSKKKLNYSEFLKILRGL